MTPQTVCEDIIEDLIPSLRGVESQPETVNGVETERYRLDEADLKRLLELLGTGSATMLPERFVADLWLLRESRCPQYGCGSMHRTPMRRGSL